MDPNTPSTPPSFQPESPQPTTSNNQPRKSKKTLIITLVVVGAVLLLALIAGLIFASLNKSDSQPNKSTTNSSLYYDRPGYDRAKLGASIGDPLAITMTPQKKTQELTDGTKVIPACSVLSQKELADQGFKLYPNDFGYPILQNYLSKSGDAAFGADPAQVPLSDATISCSYGFEGSQAVAITVNQDFTVKPAAVDSWAESLNFQPTATIDGYEVSKREKQGDVSYLLRKDSDAIYLRFDKMTTETSEKLMKQAIKNLKSFANTPTGPSDIAYKSPTFTDKYIKSCDLIDNADMKALAGNDASPLVQEFWPTATGVADYSRVSEYKTKSNYLRNACIRVANSPDYKMLVGNKKHTLSTTATTYETEEAAKNGLKFYSAGENNDTVQTVEGIGNEALVYTNKDGESTLALRQGKVVVELLYDHAQQFADPTLTNLKSYSEKLSPTAKSVAAKLTSN